MTDPECHVLQTGPWPQQDGGGVQRNHPFLVLRNHMDLRRTAPRVMTGSPRRFAASPSATQAEAKRAQMRTPDEQPSNWIIIRVVDVFAGDSQGIRMNAGDGRAPPG